MRVVPGRKKVGDPIRRGGYSVREKVGEGGGGEGGGRPERPPLKQCGARRNGAREAVAAGAWERVAARPLFASPPRAPSPHLSSAMGDIGTRMDVGEKGRVERLRRGGFRGVGCSRRRRKKSRRGSRRLAASAYTSQSIGTRHLGRGAPKQSGVPTGCGGQGVCPRGCKAWRATGGWGGGVPRAHAPQQPYALRLDSL
eukprot:7378276-Prymnesium_polylepis.2